MRRCFDLADAGGSHRVLHGLAVWKDLEPRKELPHGAAAQQIAAALTTRGYAVDLDVGMSHFRCDIAVRRHGESWYRVGSLLTVMCALSTVTRWEWGS